VKTKIESNQTSERENRILQVLNRSTLPMGIEEIMEQSAMQLSKATVLRCLDDLLGKGWVERTGKARATRYVLTEAGRMQLGAKPKPMALEARPEVRPVRYSEFLGPSVDFLREPGAEDPFASDLPEEDPMEMAERERLRALIRRPVGQRMPIGYQRDFLEDYVPNVTFYLPEKLREELRRVGQSDNMARLPEGTYVRSVFNRVLVDLSWNSSRLEGNTFSLLETDRLLALGRSDDPARMLEARMILNHKEAIEFLVDAPDDIGFNRYTILNLHAMLANELLGESYDEGRLRRIAVGIGGCAYQPLDIPQVIEQCFMLILEKAGAIQDPLEAAFFVMVHFPYLQPFVDVNKRVSRLAANIPLIRANLAPLTFVDVPARDYTDAVLAVYELNRVELLRDVFARAYRASAARYSEVRRGLHAPDPLGMIYQEALRSVARDVVQRQLGKTAAADYVRRWSVDQIREEDRGRVVELAERSLMNLHEGNFAKYRLRPSEFAAWQAVWARDA
jgi:Fic family protein/DNA-binding PadR family transcriptional regulator